MNAVLLNEMALHIAVLRLFLTRMMMSPL